ncbi:LysR family transcriptional regulator [Variovorax saccharolyticus]|uniref:LysR family transcriptional regulator n=1 Tax=Variovorax saccharolyticus TaxID=3053516 RepID=UPI0025764774|nr:LysR family transcriptional regulator [Variovorax sp. J22R187]MDM0020999.1 LysR family transcriptional regulator [Variovorax sp. J22R187]
MLRRPRPLSAAAPRYAPAAAISATFLMPDHDRLLRTFLVVSQSGSLRKAADTLELTPPGVSKQISALEKSLGGPLFKRHGRGMDLTPLGRRLAVDAGGGFALLDAALDAARSASSTALRSVSIATVNTLAAYLVPAVVAALRRSHPELVVRVDNASSPDVVDQVLRGHADIGLVYDLAVDTDAVHLVRLGTENLSAYGSASAAPGPAGDIGLAELARRPLIVPPRPYALRRVIERELPGPLSIAAECNSVSVSLDLAAAGVGTTILPSALPEAAVSPRGLRRMRIAGGNFDREVVLIHLASTPPGRAVAATLQAIEDFAARLA